MKNEINAVLENMTTVTPEPEDYTGELNQRPPGYELSG